MMFASRTRARAINTRLALATASKGNQSVTEYVGKMRALGDEMAAAGRPLEDAELMEYILTGPDSDYTPVISALAVRLEPVSVDELYSQLLAFESRMDLITGGGSGSGSSVNLVNRGDRGGSRGRGNSQGRGNGRGNGYNNNARQGGAGRGQQHSTAWQLQQQQLLTSSVSGLP